jgi:hypothetical protein
LATRRWKEQFMADKLAVMASSPADYVRLGLSPTSIAPWEDGARTDDSAGTYEWRYFDAHLADGAKLVVTFMNKDTAEPQKPLSPCFGWTSIFPTLLRVVFLVVWVRKRRLLRSVWFSRGLVLAGPLSVVALICERHDPAAA